MNLRNKAEFMCSLHQMELCLKTTRSAGGSVEAFAVEQLSTAMREKGDHKVVDEKSIGIK